MFANNIKIKMSGKMYLAARAPPKFSGKSFKGKFTGKYKRKYARSSVKKSTIRENRLVAKVMDRVSENKIMPVTEYKEVNPYPIQLGAQGYMWAGVLGDLPSAWNASYWQPLGTLTPNSGVGHAQRIGNQIFLKKTTITMNVDAEKRTDPLPMEFRTIVAKPRRSRNPSGSTIDPYENLFLNGNGSPVGPGTSGQTNPQLFNSMINLRDFCVYSDTYNDLMGTAQANQQLATQTTNMGPSYKAHFRKQFSMPHNIKAHIAQGSSGKITNYDSSYFIVILARTIGQDDAAGRWNVWLQGATSFNDS